MEGKLRQYVCLGAAGVLVIAGTIATGVFPPTTLYQVLAGGIIVAGFVIGYLCVGAFEFLE